MNPLARMPPCAERARDRRMSLLRQARTGYRILHMLALAWGFAGVAFPGPPLPEVDGSVTIAAQEWPMRPGPRSVTAHVRYPGGRLTGVNSGTGLMLSLHNWGGVGFVGAPDPAALVDAMDLVVIGVDYLQSGPDEALQGLPYDFGYLQALDALRGLHWAMESLSARGISFDSGRLFATGGSGGGNVALMAHKLAPRTFAAVADLSGMKRLSDDIAFGLPGGSSLNARYSRVPSDPAYLSPDRQQLHDLANLDHLRILRALGSKTRLITVHGREDTTCPFADAEQFATNARAAGFEVETWFIGAEDLDGDLFADAGHSLGDRTRILHHVAGRYLRPNAPDSLRRSGATDFDRREVIRLSTTNGAYEVDYRYGIPIGRRVESIPE